MSRLGRNPFEKSESKKSPIEKPPTAHTRAEKVTANHSRTFSDTFSGKFARFLRVDLPAEGFIFGLKTALLLRSIWD